MDEPRLRYRLVGFDFDGTLADSAQWFLRAFNQMADEFQFARIDETEHDIVRGYDTREFARHVKLPLWKLPRILARLRFLAASECEQIRLFSGIDRLLEQLQRREILLAIVSSNSEATIRRVL